MNATGKKRQSTKLKALLVDDDQDQIVLLSEILSQSKAADYEIYSAQSLKAAYQILNEQPVDIIILDLNLPDSKGLDTLQSLYKEFFEIPVVVITGIDDQKCQDLGLTLGAEDYIIKGCYNVADIHRSIDHAIKRHEQILIMDQKRQALSQQLDAIKSGDVDVIITNTSPSKLLRIEDSDLVAKNERLLKELEHLAHHDTLTKLPNRFHFEKSLKQILSTSLRYGHKFAVMILDLDRFKLINDSYGHDIGDDLLVQASKRMYDCLRSDDIVARLGGDEFGIILREINTTTGVEATAKKIVKMFEEPFMLGNKKACVTVSVGIACFPGAGSVTEDLIKHADIALYRVKNAGRNGFAQFQKDVEKEYVWRLEVENELHSAIENNEFSMVYQPIINLTSKKIVGMEALICWTSPQLGVISPDEFLPVAEESGLINQIGLWTMETVSSQQAKWIQKNMLLPVAIKLSPRQAMQTNLVDMFFSILEKNHAPTTLIQLEVTEAAIMSKDLEWKTTLEKFHDRGIHILVDDFGTGYSSLSQLKSLPIESIKIDISFIRNVTVSHHEMVIVKSIISLAKGLGLIVIAEGVEKEQQVQLLMDNGCDQAQGRYFCNPLSAEEFIQFYENSNKDSAAPDGDDIIHDLCLYARDIGHDFNNIYAAIKGYVGLLQHATSYENGTDKSFIEMNMLIEKTINIVQKQSKKMRVIEKERGLNQTTMLKNIMYQCRMTALELDSCISQQKDILDVLRESSDENKESYRFFERMFDLADKAHQLSTNLSNLIENVDINKAQDDKL